MSVEIFTTMRVSEGKCEFFEAHRRRLVEQAKAFRIDHEPPSLQEVEAFIAKEGAGHGVWKLRLSMSQEGGKGWLLEKYEGPFRESCRLAVYPHVLQAPFPEMKHSLRDGKGIREWAQREKGCDDAITTTREGIVLETGCSNIFWVHEGELFIPDLSLPYLKGVFLRESVLKSDLPIKQVCARVEEIPKGAEIFISNALTHARPVREIVLWT